MDADEVFAHLEEILNSAAVISKKRIEVLWARKKSDNEIVGFVRIDNRAVWFEATYYGDTMSFWVWIEGKWFNFEFSQEEIEKAIELVKQ